MKKNTIRAYVTQVTRVPNSRDGNPRWLVFLAGHDNPFRTAADSQVGFSIGESMLFHEYDFDFEDGLVIRVREVDPWENTPEPNRGSVVLLHSDTGTVAQRFNSDGLWRKAGSTGRFSWGDLKVQSPYYLKVLLSTPDL